MSEVLIKGMDMPQGSCEWVDKDGYLHRCKLLNGDDDCKMQEGICADATWEEQFANCPLVEIEMPHGRLIDAQKLLMDHGLKLTEEFAPTVIESEVREE